MPQIYIEEVIVIAVKFEKTGVVNASGEGVNPNLHKNSNNLTDRWTKDNATISNGIATIDGSASGNKRIYQMPANGGWTWKASTQYTASVFARTDDSGSIYFGPVGGNTSNSGSISVTKEWERYSYTFTTGSSPTTGSMSYYFGSSGTTVQLKYPKLEESSTLTPWCPNETDDIYTGTAVGFAEANGNPSIGKAGYVQATEFIEW